MHPDPIDPERCAKVIGTLAAPERLRVLHLLAGGPLTVSQIAAALDVPLFNLSHHLAVLKAAGLIRGVKRGRFVHYSLRPGVLVAEAESDPARRVFDLGCCELAFAPDW